MFYNVLYMFIPRFLILVLRLNLFTLFQVPVDLRLDNQELRCAEDIRAVVEARRTRVEICGSCSWAA